jgi:hypothetical protein
MVAQRWRVTTDEEGAVDGAPVDHHEHRVHGDRGESARGHGPRAVVEPRDVHVRERDGIGKRGRTRGGGCRRL